MRFLRKLCISMYEEQKDLKLIYAIKVIRPLIRFSLAMLFLT